MEDEFELPELDAEVVEQVKALEAQEGQVEETEANEEVVEDLEVDGTQEAEEEEETPDKVVDPGGTQKDHEAFANMRIQLKEAKKGKEAGDALIERMMKSLNVSTVEDLEAVLNKAEEQRALEAGHTPETYSKQKSLEEERKAFEKEREEFAAQKEEEVAGNFLAKMDGYAKEYNVTREEVISAIGSSVGMELKDLLALPESAQNTMYEGALLGRFSKKEQVERPKVETTKPKGSQTDTGKMTMEELLDVALKLGTEEN